jgi:hypothetical protein
MGDAVSLGSILEGEFRSTYEGANRTAYLAALRSWLGDLPLAPTKLTKAASSSEPPAGEGSHAFGRCGPTMAIDDSRSRLRSDPKHGS